MNILSRYYQHQMLLIILLFSILTPVLAVELPEKDSRFEQQITMLKEAARRDGKIPVIIKLRTAFNPEGKINDEKINDQRASIKRSGDAVLKSLKNADPGIKVIAFDKLPYLATMANEKVIDALSKDSNVILVYQDFTTKPTLNISTPLIQGNIAFSQGFSGQGQTVAVIDSGVKLNHAFLKGKIVSQACFSGSAGGVSLCPGNASSSFAAGSAEDCPVNVSGCGHGTHVAGIAVGKNGQFSGVAKDAKLIAIKTATRNGNAINHSTTDIARGLNRVYDLRNNFKISSVNLSLGDSTLNQGACDSSSPLVTDAINQLKSVGIATVVSAGNNAYKNGMSWPACISSAISVGNSVSELQANAQGYAVDDVWVDSNISAATDLLAPGTKIYSSSSKSATAYADNWGTSMAAPHVAGAFAVLKAKNSTLSVDTLLAAMKDSGIGIHDQRSGGIHSVPRINVASALTLIAGNSTFKGLTPSGTTTGSKPTFRWKPLPGQTHYWVIADNSSSLQWPYVIYNTVSATDANCGSGVCQYTTSNQVFAPGAAVWKVQAPQSSGAWPETNLLGFTIN